MRKPRPSALSRRQFATGSLALAGLSLAPIALSSRARAAGEVNLYSARHYPADEILFELFTRETGIKVNMIQGKAEELMERVKLEGANSPCDIFVTVDAGNLWRAQEAGVFQSVQSAYLTEHVPAQYHEPEGKWFGFSTRARVIVYDKTRVKPDDLSTYEDLTDPKWKGRILIRSSNNIYNQSLLASLVEHHGEAEAEAWAKGLVANFARDPEGGDTDQIKALIAGQGDIAISNTYYFARIQGGDDAELKKQAENLAVFFPNQQDRGTHVNISGAGVAAHAPNRDNAVKFLEFMATPAAQEIFSGANFEYPVVEGSKASDLVSAWGDFKRDTLNVSALGRNNPVAVRIMDRAGWR
ncbi:MAG: Fe(3+) ABC transporter substrate-binding protein [Rhodospirillaceae bacterium]|nr:Fe(3+) ABC transporter substrate-binding protein [Rhodospirillaceae bacterium]